MKISQPPDNETELVEQAQRGEQRAFHVLVDRHAGWLFGLAVRLVGDRADAEDLVQESLAGAFGGLSSFRGLSSVRTWLARILVRQAARHYRKAGRRKCVTESLEQDLSGSPGTSAQKQADMRMDISRALLALSPDFREVIVLRELQGLSYEEIALILDVPRGTVESRLFRARKLLQEALKDYMA